MAFTKSSSSSISPSLNVTPLIDILLVLIIIFMVITPSTSQGLKTTVPQLPDTIERAAPPPRSTLVLSVAADLTVRLNRELVARVDLPDRLRAWAKGQAEPVLFVDGARTLEFGAVAEVMDTARGAGVVRMALMPGTDSGHKSF